MSGTKARTTAKDITLSDRNAHDTNHANRAGTSAGEGNTRIAARRGNDHRRGGSPP